MCPARISLAESANLPCSRQGTARCARSSWAVGQEGFYPQDEIIMAKRCSHCEYGRVATAKERCFLKKFRYCLTKPFRAEAVIHRHLQLWILQKWLWITLLPQFERQNLQDTRSSPQIATKLPQISVLGLGHTIQSLAPRQRAVGRADNKTGWSRRASTRAPDDRQSQVWKLRLAIGSCMSCKWS